MKTSPRVVIKRGFGFLLFLAVLMVVGYWYYKYKIEDRDIGVVDYTLLEDSNDVHFPLMSLCFADPFIEEQLNNTNINVSMESYIKYLKGELFEDHFYDIEYNKVTLRLKDYFLFAKEGWHNDTQNIPRNSTLTFEHEEIFSGFHYEDFIKCFLIKQSFDDHRYIKQLSLKYDLQSLIYDWSGNNSDSSLILYFKFHYPSQFFLKMDNRVFRMNSFDSYYRVWIDEYEILNGRNSRNRICSENTDSYDYKVLDQYLSEKGCKDPYIKGETKYPLCQPSNNTSGMQFEYQTRVKLNIPAACNKISNMRITQEFGTKSDQPSEIWSLDIQFLNEVRIITQSKEVDFHTLVGNIGGYLGLFLGKLFI